MKIFAAALCAGLTALAHPVLADVVTIPGPSGPLEGEAIPVPDAAHVVVIIPGSGPTDRDGNGPEGAPGALRSDTYRLLAEGLAEAGVASIRIDKRGMFGSSDAIADANAVTLAGYARDARDWVAEAATMADCVWLAGHSEGGLVALLAAQDAPEALCGLLLLATPGRPLGIVLREQLAANPMTAGLSAEIDAVLTRLEAGEAVPANEVPPMLHGLLAGPAQGYLIDLISHDPAALAANWGGPALVLQGGRDMQVGAADAEALARSMPQAQRADLPEVTHMLKTDVPGQPFATYLDPSLPLDPCVIPAIVALLTAPRD